MKYIYQLSVVLSIFTLIGCNNDNLEFKNTKILEIGDYSLDFPEQFNLEERQGIDSYVGTVN